VGEVQLQRSTVAGSKRGC